MREELQTAGPRQGRWWGAWQQGPRFLDLLPYLPLHTVLLGLRPQRGPRLPSQTVICLSVCLTGPSGTPGATWSSGRDGPQGEC